MWKCPDLFRAAAATVPLQTLDPWTIGKIFESEARLFP